MCSSLFMRKRPPRRCTYGDGTTSHTPWSCGKSRPSSWTQAAAIDINVPGVARRFGAMTVRLYLQIFVVIAMLCAGQLLFRQSALSVPPLSTVAGLLGLARNPAFLVALALYGGATVLWVGVLQQVPLSRAYPFM